MIDQLTPMPLPDVRTRHALALARYRLGDLVVADEARYAFELWRAVVESGDEDVGPFAAYALAKRIGDRFLVAPRIEELLRIAVHGRHPTLCSRASIDVARYLAGYSQFRQALDYLSVGLERGDDALRADVERAVAQITLQQEAADELTRMARPRRRH